MTSISPFVRNVSLAAACLLLLFLQPHHTNAFQPSAACVLSSSLVMTTNRITLESTALSSTQQSVHDLDYNDDNEDELSKKRPNSRRKFMDKAMKASGVTASTLTFGMLTNFDLLNMNANAMDLNLNTDHPTGCTCAFW